MLYCPGTATCGSNSTSSTTTTDCTCQCPGCNCYVIVRVTESNNFGFEPPPIIPRDLPIWPRPLSDLWPLHIHAARRTGFNRPGRELRHRGAFRNFHK